VMSTDGTVLASQSVNPVGLGASNQLNIYSLPSGVLVNSFPFGSASAPTLIDMTLSAPGTVIGERLLDNTLAAIPVGGGAPIWVAAGAAGGVEWQPLLSPDATLSAIAGEPQGFGTATQTSMYKNGSLQTALSGWAVGWIDNDRLLVNNYDSNKVPTYLGSSIYDAMGVLVNSPSLPQLLKFQVVTPQLTMPDLIYSPALNTIFSISSGAAKWASGSPSTGPNASPGIGAVAGQQIVFMSGNLVLAEPH
jgi:hypothetical protein